MMIQLKKSCQMTKTACSVRRREPSAWWFLFFIGLQLGLVAQIDSSSFLLNTQSTSLSRVFDGSDLSIATDFVIISSERFTLDTRSPSFDVGSGQSGAIPGSDLNTATNAVFAVSASFTLDTRSAAQRGGMPGADLAGALSLVVVDSSKFLLDTRSFAALWIDIQPRSQTVGFGESVTLSVAAVGAGQIRYQWQFKGQPIQGATSPELLLPSFQPNQAGEYRVVLVDQFGTLTSDPAVLEGLANRPPVVEFVGSTSLDEMTPLALSANATDPDRPAQAITFSLLEGPVGLQIQPDGVINWTPTESQGPSTNVLRLLVSDGIARVTNQVSIVVREINRPPAFVNSVSNAEVAPGDMLSVALAAQDPDQPANRLTWRLVSGPAGSSVNPTNGLWNWKPSTLIPPGSNQVTIAVDDDGVPQLSATNRFSAVVRDASAVVTNQLALRIDSHVVASGGEVRVPVTVQNFNLVDTLQFTLEWDPSVIAFKGLEAFGLPGLTESNFGMAKDSQGRTNRLTFSWDDSTFIGVTRTNGAALFETLFVGVGELGAATSVRFSGNPTPSVASVNAAEVPLTTLSGSVTILSRLSGLIDYFASTGGPLSGVTVTMGGEGSGAITTGADGGYSMEMPGGAFTVTPTLETDTPPANGVTTADITLLRRHILGITALDSAHKVLAGDVNGSSSATTADITLIRRLILGVSTNFTGGLWRFVPADEVFTNAMSPWTARRSRSYATAPSVMTGHDFKAIKLGDVNGSWKAPTTSGASTIQAKSKPKAQLVVGSGRNLGDGVTVHSVTLRGVRSLTSLQFTLAWDPAEAAYVGIEAGALKDLSPENLGTARAGQGLVSVSWDPANGVARDLGGEAIVLGLKLKARPGRTLSRLTVPERPTALEVTEATVPVSVGVVGWSARTDGLSALGGVGDSGGPTSAAAGPLAPAARLRVLGPDAAGQAILEVTAAEGQTVQVQWSMDLKSWTSVWQGSGEGPQSPIRVEPQGLSPSGARFWRVIPVGR